MNNKGFMMAEVVIVSSIVLVFLTGLYVSYNKLYSIYNSRISYYDIVTLYRLGYYRDYLLGELGNDGWNSLLDKATPVTTDATGEIDNRYSGDTVYILKNNDKNLDDDVNSGILTYFENSDDKITLKEYIQYLSTSVTFKDNEYDMNYVMILESCSVVENVVDVDDCKYAYLEVDKK